MGSDMCICVLYSYTDTVLDWGAGRDAIRNWTATNYPNSETPAGWAENYYWDEYDTDEFGELTQASLDKIRDQAIEQLEIVKDICVGSSREVAEVILGPYAVWATGGMTGGDDPTDAYSAFNSFSETPAAIAVGFFPRWDPNMALNDKILDSYIRS